MAKKLTVHVFSKYLGGGELLATLVAKRPDVQFKEIKLSDAGGYFVASEKKHNSKQALRIWRATPYFDILTSFGQMGGKKTKTKNREANKNAKQHRYLLHCAKCVISSPPQADPPHGCKPQHEKCDENEI